MSPQLLLDTDPSRLCDASHPQPSVAWQADIAVLDFGLVACGFSHECTFTLRNTSVVPARYSWRALGASSPAATQAELQAHPVPRLLAVILALPYVGLVESRVCPK